MIEFETNDDVRCNFTLKAAAYGIPIGKLAKIANNLFCHTLGNARLWVIS